MSLQSNSFPLGFRRRGVACTALCMITVNCCQRCSIQLRDVGSSVMEFDVQTTVHRDNFLQ